MFFGKSGSNMGPWTDFALPKSYSTQIDLSNKLLYVSNRDWVPKLRPREVDVPTYPKQGPQFGVSSSRVRFCDIKGFPLFLNNK